MGWGCQLKHPALRTARVFRVNGFEKILIFYQPDPDPIEILRVLHRSQDLEAIFERVGPLTEQTRVASAVLSPKIYFRQ